MDKDEGKDIYGLVGRSIQHSLSPIIYNSLYTKHGIDAEYRLFDMDNLSQFMKEVRDDASRIQGLNITKPYKIEVFKYLDEVGQEVKRIGSSNTVSITDGMIKGFNTDGVGAKRALTRFTDIENKKVLQLGAGGAGKAIAYELSRTSEVTVLNRTLKKARSLEKFGVEVNRLSKEILKRELETADILINTTSVGMDEKRSLVDIDLMKEGLTVFDIVYSPLDTKLLKDAERTGCQTIDGIWMLIYQAVQAFQIWMGIEPDPARLRKILMAEIS
ncbi:MAG: shikimate dehydrogenase [Candidatus Natronoplasma sp.]